MDPHPEQRNEIRKHGWDDLGVDGIPVGDGFGVSVESEDEQHFMPSLQPHVAIGYPRYRRLWLTQRNWRGEYIKLREISPLCVITARRGDQRIVFDQGRSL